MGIFGSIKNAIFGRDEEEKAPAAPEQQQAAPAAQAAPPQPSEPAAITEVDVAARLDGIPGADELNWRTSIVDLMKLIEVDSSYEARKELAQELGNADYEGSAEDNIQLHRQTMQELARNGGKVPAEFLN